MVLGVNELGESSAYLYNGLGALVENTWVIKKNAYGYHDVSALTIMVEREVVVDYYNKLTCEQKDYFKDSFDIEFK
ncbi:MAG: hypothetical protein VB128_11510 [Sedimentibacter saalensis]|uniref:hypothetical protein n=1 Tax=Sedimentibacter saalensis TaxID=130788 RepID=UPI002B1F31D8|nr:hypothetical protein [Sedimentibacter saalensis]MEA5095569.1 hypothetical protein [Sedimentibacter saalensis]